MATKKLSITTKTLASVAAKNMGIENAFSLLEEELPMGQAMILKPFLEWVALDVKTRGFGVGNFDLRFNQYLKETSTK